MSGYPPKDYIDSKTLAALAFQPIFLYYNIRVLYYNITLLYYNITILYDFIQDNLQN